jgi:hypothetical protein
MFDINESSSFTKYIAAGSPYTPEIVLTRLSLEPHVQLRRRIAENPHTPAEVLTQLAHDPNPDVRLALWENPATSAAMIDQLSQDESPDVRFAMASDPELDATILRRLMQDYNPFVAERAYRSFCQKHNSSTTAELPTRNDNGDVHKAV